MRYRYIENISKNFVDNFLKFLPGKKSLFIGNLASNEFIKSYKAETLSKKNLEKLKERYQRSINQDEKEEVNKNRFLFKLRNENSFLIKSDNRDDFRKDLKLKPDFDFIFSDNFKPIKSSSTRVSPIIKMQEAFTGDPENFISNMNEVFKESSLENFKAILEQAEYLKEDGVIAFILDESVLIRGPFAGAKLEELLSSKGFYINAVLGIESLKSGFVNHSYHRDPFGKKSIFIFSRRKTELLFIVDAKSESFNYSNLFGFLYNFSQSNISTNIDLENGFLIDKDDFKNYSGVQARSRVEKFKISYKDYKVVNLGDLILDGALSHGSECDKVNNGKKNFIQLLYNFKVETDKIATAESNPLSGLRDYFITLKTEVASSYVAIFLQSELGRSLYESYLTVDPKGRPGYILLEENVKKIPIFIPNLNVQNQIIEAHNKIIKLQNSIDRFSDGLSLNPNAFLGESIQKIDVMLDEVGKLNDADRIRSWIHGFESKAVEFKQTWKLPTKGEKKKDFTDSSDRMKAGVFKVINSFINSYGGNLIIGISDEKHEIMGIEPELEHFYTKKEPIVKKIDRFENHFRSALATAFSPDFVKLVDFRPVSLDEKYVYLVSCSPGVRPCFIKDPTFISTLKNNDFYVREGANSMPKHGEDLVTYCSDHFVSD